MNRIKAKPAAEVKPYQPVFYISGPMSGYEDYNYPAFREAEEHLRSLNYTMIRNPCVLDSSLPYRKLIDLCLKMMRDCDVIFLLDGWQKSNGAKLEHQYAVTTGMEIIYPEDRKAYETGCLASAGEDRKEVK